MFNIICNNNVTAIMEHETPSKKFAIFGLNCTITTYHFHSFLHDPLYFCNMIEPDEHIMNILDAYRVANNIRVKDFDSDLINVFRIYMSTDGLVDVKKMDIILSILDIINKYRHNYYLVRDIIIDIFIGGAERLHKLSELLKRTISNGYINAIASRGIKHEIINFLECVNLANFFDANLIFDTRKDKMIIDFLVGNHSVLYIDDDHKEHNLLINYLQTNEMIREIISFGHLIKYVITNNTTYQFYDGLTMNGRGLTIEIIDTIFV